MRQKETASLLSSIQGKYSTSGQTEYLMVHAKKYLQVIFFQQGKTASLVMSKLCWFLLYSLWVLNKNATSTRSLTGHEIVWFHFRPGCTMLLTNYYVCSHRNKELAMTLRAPESSHHIVQPFQNALITLQVVIFLLPLLRWRLCQTPIIYS